MKSFIIFFSIFIGCSSPPLKPIPMEQRYPLVIKPMEDLTGDYQGSFLPFEKLITPVLLDDYIGVHEPKTSRNEFSYIKIYPNPIRLVNLEGNENSANVMTGEVERIAYEPYNNIKGAIATYAIEGLLGLLMTGEDGDMAGYVQYRFHLCTSNGVPIDSFVVIGVARGNVEQFSRRQLLEKANRKALYLFPIKLLEYVDKRVNWNLPSKRIESTRKLMNSITNLKLLLN